MLFCNSNTSGRSVFLLCTTPVIWICMRRSQFVPPACMKMWCSDKLSKGLIGNGKWPPKICPQNKMKCLEGHTLPAKIVYLWVDTNRPRGRISKYTMAKSPIRDSVSGDCAFDVLIQKTDSICPFLSTIFLALINVTSNKS